AYVTGSTGSTDFPTLNPYQTDHGGYYYDAFVTKLSSSGNSLVYSTYLGGSNYDWGFGIAVDGSGSAHVTGQTRSTDFPTLNPYQTNNGGGYNDVFVTKLSSSGNSLVYSTYLGGSGGDEGWSIAVDSSGSAYLTGNTYSTDFPTLNSYQTYQGNIDAFVTKLSISGNSLLYSTYLGGSSVDSGMSIAVDGSGSAYVTGSTGSTDFPTLNPYQNDQGGDDVFVTKLSSLGNSLLYSTYLGGSSLDRVKSIAVDSSGSAYLTGYTGSTDFPTLYPYQTDQGGEDVFVTKLSSSGNSLIYSTYLGGSGYDWGYGIAVDDSGSAYVTGSTGSTDFPTLNPYQTDQGGTDVFVTKLSYGCCIGIRGNINYDPGDVIDISDLVYLVDYMFNGGPQPVCWEEANVDGSGDGPPDGPEDIDIADLVHLVDYMFNQGPPPVPCP
ncbi:MAG: SBBP repeat-containing protein, partial [candidate division Zixibacteria bacterium]|nr:SBBP repeat-containing protein [candidate division Zixibacteria bacterium]